MLTFGIGSQTLTSLTLTHFEKLTSFDNMYGSHPIQEGQ